MPKPRRKHLDPLTPEQQELVLKHRWLVNHVAGPMWERSRFVRKRLLTFEDVLAAGYLGLIYAVQLYDPELGFTFSTYAAKSIRNQIICAAIDALVIHVPSYIQWRKCKTRRKVELEAAGRLAENARHLVDESEWIRLPASAEPIQEDYSWLLSEIARLPAREQTILRLRFWEGLHLEEIGRRFSLTTERIRQILTLSLRRLQRALSEQDSDQK